MAYASDLHIAVYQVLDQVMIANVPPPGAVATIHAIIDDLRSASAPQHMVRHAEEISLELHLLTSAVSTRDAALASMSQRTSRGSPANGLTTESTINETDSNTERALFARQNALPI